MFPLILEYTNPPRPARVCNVTELISRSALERADLPADRITSRAGRLLVREAERYLAFWAEAQQS